MGSLCSQASEALLQGPRVQHWLRAHGGPQRTPSMSAEPASHPGLLWVAPILFPVQAPFGHVSLAGCTAMGLRPLRTSSLAPWQLLSDGAKLLPHPAAAGLFVCLFLQKEVKFCVQSLGTKHTHPSDGAAFPRQHPCPGGVEWGCGFRTAP